MRHHWGIEGVSSMIINKLLGSLLSFIIWRSRNQGGTPSDPWSWSSLVLGSNAGILSCAVSPVHQPSALRFVKKSAFDPGTSQDRIRQCTLCIQILCMDCLWITLHPGTWECFCDPTPSGLCECISPAQWFSEPKHPRFLLFWLLSCYFKNLNISARHSWSRDQPQTYEGKWRPYRWFVACKAQE
jgi:hypothetical protein